MDLREYQVECLIAIKKALMRGVFRQLIALPTGTGKTICFASLAQKLNRRTLILAHRDELLDQAINKICEVWPEIKGNIGKVKAERNEFDRQIVVASVQSAFRDNRLEQLEKQNFKVLIVDEAHHAAADSYKKIFEQLGFMNGSQKLLVGVTATPGRLDGKALGDIFEEITFERTIASMIRAGYLCDLRGLRIQTGTNISGVKISQGDFAVKELSSIINTEDRNKIIVKTWKEKASSLKTIAFCVDVEHSQSLAMEFQKEGIKAEAVWGDMAKEDRKAVLRKFNSGKVQIITNCNLLTEGFDEPSLRCLLMCRPTKSKSMYMQMVGRGTRLFMNKTECLVIDFTDNRHDICLLGTLLGKDVKPGRSLMEELLDEEKATKEKNPLQKSGAVSSSAFDLTERSNFRWFEVPDFGWRLPISPGNYVFLRSIGEEKFIPVLQEDCKFTEKLSDIPLSLGYAQGVAEDYARKHIQFAGKDAAWRTRDISPGQLKLLEKLGIPISEKLSKGEASDLIEAKMTKKNSWKIQPATGKQLYSLRRMGVEVPDGLTKGEASRLFYLNKKEKVEV